MNVQLTGIAPMLAAVKGSEALNGFEFRQLSPPQQDAWFDPKVDCGGRGFKYFNQATRYMIAAMRQLDLPPGPRETDPEAGHKGVVIGSNSCTRRELDEFDAALLQSGYLAIDPMRAPSFCANVGTGNIGIKHQAKAFNITLTNPFTAGLEAVVLAKHAILEGRAQTAYAGAMEDESEFVVDAGIAVNTRGGAWAVRLQADASARPDDGLATIGASLHCFIPQGVTIREALLQRLTQDFQPLVRDRSGLSVLVAMPDTEHCRLVVDVLKQVMDRLGIAQQQIEVTTDLHAYGTLLPLAQLSWSALHLERALCIAVSPLGHITCVEITQAERS